MSQGMILIKGMSSEHEMVFACIFVSIGVVVFLVTYLFKQEMMKEAGVNYLAYIIWILFIFSVLVVGIAYCMNIIKGYMDRKNKEENE